MNTGLGFAGWTQGQGLQDGHRVRVRIVYREMGDIGKP